MCRLQFYRNIQKKSTNPSIRTLVSTLQCRFLCVFRILPYAHSAKAMAGFLLSCCRHAAVWNCDRQCVLRYRELVPPYVRPSHMGNDRMGFSFPPVPFSFGWCCGTFVDMDWISEKIYSRNDCSGGHCCNNPMSSALGSFLFPSSAFYSVGRCSNPRNGSCEKSVLSSRKYGSVSNDGKRI